jgi:flagellar basal body rod protein FlgG
MNHGYSDVLGRISSMRAASDNIQLIDEMITGMNNAHDRRTGATLTPAEQLQANLGLVEQLGDMIVARRAYRANNRVLAITDALLDKLNPM